MPVWAQPELIATDLRTYGEVELLGDPDGQLVFLAARRSPLAARRSPLAARTLRKIGDPAAAQPLRQAAKRATDSGARGYLNGWADQLEGRARA